MKTLFVTGTDTDVGKTLVSALLARGWARAQQKVSYWKPVQTGVSPGQAGDREVVADVCAQQEVTVYADGYRFALAASPDQAAAAEGRSPPDAAAILARQPRESEVDIAIVEGAGGLLVPLAAEGENWLDLLRQTCAHTPDGRVWPVLLVARSGLGTLNHTALSLAALDHAAIPVLAVVLSGELHAKNLGSLRRRFPEVMFVALPKVADDERARDEAADLLAQNISQAFEQWESREAAADWLAADHAHAWHPYTQHATAPSPIPIVRARGSWLHTASGLRLFDATSAWWTNNIGHGRPEVGRAIARQQAELDHVLFAGAAHQPAALLAAKLAQLAAPLSRVFYSDNGSTAVEVALKIAFQAWVNRGDSQRTSFLAFRGSYHGDTFGAMAIAAADGFHGIFRPFLFAPLLADPVTSHPSPLCPEGPKALESRLAALAEQLERHTDAHCPSRVAAVILEPCIQGAGGMLVHADGFVAGVARLCRRFGVPLILDEVLTGFGRVGDRFAFQKCQVTPDLVCIAKGLTGGTLPLAATLASEAMFQAMMHPETQRALLHGHSFTANPIACAAALTAIAIMEREDLPGRARAMEAIYRQWIATTGHDLGIIAGRACGGILAFELPGSEGAHYFHAKTRTIAETAVRHGLWLRTLGNTVYFMPPLSTPTAELESALAALAETLRDLAAS